MAADGDMEVEQARTGAGDKKKWWKRCCPLCMKIMYLVLSVVTIIKCIIVMVLAVSSAILSKSYSPSESGRVAGMVVLAVTAAITMASLVGAIVAVCRKKIKPLRVVAAVLLITAVIQIVVAGTSVRLTDSDEDALGRSLSESFKMSRANNPRYARLWATTQHDLKCCGVYGPEDYRLLGSQGTILAPDVPISCCPSYDPNRSELLQEAAREKCKFRREQRQSGCKQHVVDAFQSSARMLMFVLIALIVHQILMAISSLIMTKKEKKNSESEKN